MKQLHETRLVTYRLTNQGLIEMDEMLKQGDYPNRTEITRRAVLELIDGAKSEMRASPKKKTPFKDYVQEIKKELRRAIF